MMSYMAVIPQPDVVIREITVTYNDPRVSKNGRAAKRGALVMYVDANGAATMLMKQGPGPTEWAPALPAAKGALAEYLRSDGQWASPLPALPNDTTKFLRGDFSWAVPPPPLGTIIAKTADTAFTTTTFTDVPLGASGAPTFGFDLTTGHTYHFRFSTLIRSSIANIGPGLTVSIPAASIFGAAAMMVGQSAAGSQVIYAAPITASQVPAIAASVDLANTDYIFGIEGVIVPSAAGRISLQARIETGSSATVTVRRGSYALLNVTS